MKILMTDSKNDRLLAHFYANHLRSFPDTEVASLYYPDKMDAFLISLRNRIRFRISPAAVLRQINRDIRTRIEEVRPDILWIFKGMEVFPETLDFARKRGIRLVNYNPDHPFEFATPGSGNDYVRDAIPLYDLHLSYSREILRGLADKFGVKGKYLPFGYEISDVALDSASREVEIEKACFVGVADPDRISAVRALVDRGIPIDVYGPEWHRHFRSSAQIGVFAGVYTSALWNTLRKYRLQLNVFRRQNNNSHNMRSFEVPGIGGIMLAPWSEEHLTFFDEGREAFFYRSPAEMTDHARYLLGLPGFAAADIRKAARDRSVRDDYSYRHRAFMVRQYFEELFN